MKNLEWHLIDKSTWADGEWKQEPDKIQWRDEVSGYPCLIRRVLRIGSLCGYVGVSANHPLYGYYNSWNDSLKVHGDINYASKCSGEICHLVEDGEEDDIWWFGFDCAHTADIMPFDLLLKKAMPPELLEIEERLNSFFNPQYRNVEYVKNECANLAKQLKQIELQSLNKSSPAITVV